MQPVLFHIYSFDFRAWGLMVTLGITTGTMLIFWLNGKNGIVHKEKLLDFVIYSVLAGLIGARVWEVAFSWQKYRANPITVFKFWQGGLSIQGGLLAGLLIALWFAKKYKIDFWKFIDLLAPGLILGQAFGRIGCFLNGDAFGVPTRYVIGVSYQPGTPAYNAYGSTPLFPAELLEGAGDLVILIILLLLGRRKKTFDGMIGLTYFFLYSLLRFTLEFWRGESLKNFKTAQVVSLATIIIALSLVIYHNVKVKKIKP